MPGDKPYDQRRAIAALQAERQIWRMLPRSVKLVQTAGKGRVRQSGMVDARGGLLPHAGAARLVQFWPKRTFIHRSENLPGY
jgi:hypothetical protein